MPEPMEPIDLIETYENLRKDYEYTKEIDFTDLIRVFEVAKLATKYKEALEYYEHPKNYEYQHNGIVGYTNVTEDLGKIAREALKGE